MESSEERNTKLIIAYDGTNYFGWQNVGDNPSIEKALQDAIFKLTQVKPRLNAASRTDRGVHAEGQVVSFLGSKKITLAGLNALLPPDIRILSLEYVEDDFHATLNSKGKEYQYSICKSHVMSPFLRGYVWHYPRPISLDLMREGAKILVGEHNFSSFANNGENGVRNISSIEIIENEIIKINISGDKFLYKMARNLAGTLVYIGCEKIKLQDLDAILKSKKRELAGITAPAHGLCLKRVFY